MVTQSRPRVEESVPSAARTVESLRDIGYSAPHAVADLVDNSIAAGATKVDVTVRFDGDASWIRVADNGCGMRGAVLTEAMRYGSERDYAPDDLGRFGFGLKTASTSQCREVMVAARVSRAQARIEARSLDLEHIRRRNRWEVLILDPPHRPEPLVEPLGGGPGTVVLWRRLDRILTYDDPWGHWARQRMLQLAEDIDIHLGMVFHRFLSGAVRGRRLAITVNGTRIDPWDPFCSAEPETERLPPFDVVVPTESGTGIVKVQPYVLPPQDQFTSEEAWRRASGPNKWNRQQGLYIYRANRLIQSGGWSRIRAVDEHIKLARVAVDFYPSLDAAFSINISKARVALPPELRNAMEPSISAATRRADERYRRGRPGRPSRGSAARGRTPGAGAAGGGSAPYRNASMVAPPRGNDDASTDGRRPREALERAAATVHETHALRRIASALADNDPEVAHELGW